METQKLAQTTTLQANTQVSPAVKCTICGRGFVSTNPSKESRIKAILTRIGQHYKERHESALRMSSAEIGQIIECIGERAFLIELCEIQDTQIGVVGNSYAEELGEYVDSLDNTILEALGYAGPDMKSESNDPTNEIVTDDVVANKDISEVESN